jgi:hypothetical protein
MDIAGKPAIRDMLRESSRDDPRIRHDPLIAPPPIASDPDCGPPTS